MEDGEREGGEYDWMVQGTFNIREPILMSLMTVSSMASLHLTEGVLP